MNASKFVSPLSEPDQAKLEQTYRTGKTHRERQRAQAVLLSAQGFTLDQLSQILHADRDTLSRWLDAWQDKGRAALSDAPRSGRPRKIEEQVLEALEDILANPSPDLRAVLQAELKKRG